jgi:hypothetical protein
MNRPIIVVGTPRSGTSMTAGLFAQHGVWVGPCKDGDSKNPKGYYESLPFKELLISKCGRIVHAGQLARPIPRWTEHVHSILARNGYDGGPWLVKHSAMYWPVWRDFRPIWVCCRRDPRAIERSGKASGYLTKPQAIQPHIKQMEHLRDQHGAHEVWPETFVNGDFSALVPAFEEAGLTFNHQIAEAFVEPSAWHQW